MSFMNGMYGNLGLEGRIPACAGMTVKGAGRRFVGSRRLSGLTLLAVAGSLDCQTNLIGESAYDDCYRPNR